MAANHDNKSRKERAYNIYLKNEAEREIWKFSRLITHSINPSNIFSHTIFCQIKTPRARLSRIKYSNA